MTVVDPARSVRRETYVERYFEMRQRAASCARPPSSGCTSPSYFGAMMLHAGDADLMISGVASHYADSIRVILEIIGTAPGRAARSPATTWCCCRGTSTSSPTAPSTSIPTPRRSPRQALLTAALRPRARHRAARGDALVLQLRQRRASVRAQGAAGRPTSSAARAPGLVVDGEMQLATAVDARRAGAVLPVLAAERRRQRPGVPRPPSRATWPCTCCST